MGFALGATDYLPKPVDPRRLSSVLGRYLGPTSGRTVLVVDDDPMTRDLLRRVLERERCETLEAENGRVALELLGERGPPNLILLDLMMPEMDGFTFLGALRENESWASVPVVVVTAKDISPEEQEVLSGRVQEVFTKGAYGRSELVSSVRRWIETAAGASRMTEEVN